MSARTISCIIPTFNREQSLLRTLDSLRGQTRLPHQVIVVSQGSVPSIKLDSAFVTHLRQDEPNAQRARNMAATRAAGDLLLFLDDDIQADPRLIEIFLELFQDPTIGAVCGAILEPDQKVSFDIPLTVRDSPLGWTRFPLNYGGQSPTRNFSSCNTCVRRSLHFESGGFDENFVATQYDDSDWSIRLSHVLQRHRMRGLHEGSIQLIHFRDPTGGKRPSRVSAYIKIDAEGWASRLYFWRKNYGLRAWPEFWRFVRWDLLAGSLWLRPLELCAAWREFLSGWRLASERMAGGPRYLTEVESL